SGQIYTPELIVKNILNLCNYYGKDMLKKHIIDNSCGQGAFLCEIYKKTKAILANNLLAI
ncbi:MAG: N-6 DNA methylase, partial [Campylobacter sp.]|nr:N-6 DNA methylase [Campylobacter sp.]